MKLFAAACLAALSLTACATDEVHERADAPPAAAALPESFSPWPRARTSPDASPGAVVSQAIGAEHWIRIAYHRPGVKGRDVWNDQGRFGPIVPRNADPSPWRAGANEPTTLELSKDLLLEGQPLAAGKYVLMMVPRDTHWTVVVQRFEGNGGAGRFDPDLTVLTANVQPRTAPFTEWLTYGFGGELQTGATAWLRWGELEVPFSFSVPE